MSATFARNQAPADGVGERASDYQMDLQHALGRERSTTVGGMQQLQRLTGAEPKPLRMSSSDAVWDRDCEDIGVACGRDFRLRTRAVSFGWQ
jgi:hypothetical protein